MLALFSLLDNETSTERKSNIKKHVKTRYIYLKLKKSLQNTVLLRNCNQKAIDSIFFILDLKPVLKLLQKCQVSLNSPIIFLNFGTNN